METLTPTAIRPHHWRIDEADGPMSRGVCKQCGAIKLFRNWIEKADFVTEDERRAAA